MGNYISCTLSGPVSMSSIRATKVIFPSGETRRLYEPTKAAELMLETPNFFLVSARSLQIGRRFSALNADEDLEIGAVYKTAKVLPECGGDPQVVRSGVRCPAAAPKLNLDDIEEFSMPEFQHRLSMCRSKKPLLETIVEEPVCLR
ncbi:hypothetical protein PHJA_002790500 [Phtheirospermum japonicum]|uniref:Uncharacterized protein n=1 Tax=Phtheirospermum japonicum TaxID=374723 RepID=A0A830DD75_9LAMI|nr:hypothetical protein PHJA_002790500 [Phtheirospermum japonicum]